MDKQIQKEKEKMCVCMQPKINKGTHQFCSPYRASDSFLSVLVHKPYILWTIKYPPYMLVYYLVKKDERFGFNPAQFVTHQAKASPPTSFVACQQGWPNQCLCLCLMLLSHPNSKMQLFTLAPSQVILLTKQEVWVILNTPSMHHS